MSIHNIREQIKKMDRVASVSGALTQEKMFRDATVKALTDLINLVEKEISK